MRSFLLPATFMIVSTFTFGSEPLLDSTFIHVLSKKKNTGCHKFYRVNDRDLREELDDSPNRISLGNITVNDRGNCYTGVSADIYGSYHVNSVKLFNINSKDNANVTIDIDGNADFSADLINIGNIDAESPSSIYSSVEVGSLETLEQGHIDLGNIVIEEGKTTSNYLDIATSLEIDSLSSRSGTIEAGNLLLDKEILSDQSTISIKQEIGINFKK